MNFVSCFIDVAYNYYYTIMMIILLYISALIMKTQIKIEKIKTDSTSDRDH